MKGECMRNFLMAFTMVLALFIVMMMPRPSEAQQQCVTYHMFPLGNEYIVPYTYMGQVNSGVTAGTVPQYVYSFSYMVEKGNPYFTPKYICHADKPHGVLLVEYALDGTWQIDFVPSDTVWSNFEHLTMYQYSQNPDQGIYPYRWSGKIMLITCGESGTGCTHPTEVEYNGYVMVGDCPADLPSATSCQYE
jgi:hypothetical protein